MTGDRSKDDTGGEHASDNVVGKADKQDAKMAKATRPKAKKNDRDEDTVSLHPPDESLSASKKPVRRQKNTNDATSDPTALDKIMDKLDNMASEIDSLKAKCAKRVRSPSPTRKSRSKTRSFSRSYSRSYSRSLSPKSRWYSKRSRHRISDSESCNELSNPKKHVRLSSPAPLRRDRARSRSSTDESWDRVSSRSTSPLDADPFKQLKKDIKSRSNVHTDDTMPNAPSGSSYNDMLESLESFYHSGEKTGEKINQSFAKIYDVGLRRKPNKEAMLKILDKYPRPDNLPNLITPRTNECIWDMMSKGHLYSDLSI